MSQGTIETRTNCVSRKEKEMKKNNQIIVIALTIATVIMVGCGKRLGIEVDPDGSVDGGNETLTLQYELVHMVVPTRIDRGDPVVGISFNNPNDVPVNVNRIILTRLGTAGNETIEISMLDLNQNVYNALQSRNGDRHTFETELLMIPPGEHLIHFRVFVSEPCQTIGYTVQSDSDIVASGQNGEPVQVSQGPNSTLPEPIQVFGNHITFSLAADNPQPQDVQQGTSDVIALVFNVNFQMWAEGNLSYAFLNYLPWEVAQQVTDIRMQMLYEGEWITSLGPVSLSQNDCQVNSECNIYFVDAYSWFEICTDMKLRILYDLDPSIPVSTEIRVSVDPQEWEYWDLDNDQFVPTQNMTGDVLEGSVFTVVP